MSNKQEKQYGLIIPKKQQPATKVNNIFGDDNGSDEDDGTDWVRKALKAEGEKNMLKKQTKLSMQKALKEDPTIYQYDEVYDDMERTKTQQRTAKVEEKKPRYIQNLLKAAERRKKEQEHRIERMVQKEREAEGAMFADKESFVTSAYRAKLEEFKKMDEEESRMDRLEAIADVTKQQDMSGFYRHLYEQTVQGRKQVDESNSNKQETNISDICINTNVDNKMDLLAPNEEQNVTKTKRNRQYRQRAVEVSDTDSDAEIVIPTENRDKNVLPTKSEGINEHIDEISKEPDSKRQKKEEEQKMNNVEPAVVLDSSRDERKSETKTKDGDSKSIKDDKDKVADIKKNQENKEKVSIWEKRTVGPVFDAALQRYYTRKAMKLIPT
ncbi:hypothetical protein KM043_005088 [Ampulex compressa]|nr:hypothetical protein KM043_005088 [Ampulex compressa]